MSKGKVTHYANIEAKEFGPTAPGARIRVLIGEDDGAPVYKLRMIEIDPGGNSPDHAHPYEHENFVVEGAGQVKIDGVWHDLHPGDVVFVPPGVQHQYRNAGESIFKFLCGIPVAKLIPEV
ncbi:cupin domain-containing protein [candidate division KSB1 bacterium]|nr:cupin domain-containing protein [candidate division KSB1 bacterium]